MVFEEKIITVLSEGAKGWIDKPLYSGVLTADSKRLVSGNCAFAVAVGRDIMAIHKGKGANSRFEAQLYHADFSRLPGNTTNISIRMDADLKAQADAFFAELGMNLSTAFNIFVRQSLRGGGIPFAVKLEQPNKETIAAMLEAERIARDPSVKHYSDVEEALRELKK